MNPYIDAMLRRDEGVEESAYQDSLGYWTIGVGRLIDKRKGGKLSQDEISYLLANDIARIEEQAERFEWYPELNEARQAVVLSAIFQLGYDGWSKFTETIKHIAAGDYVEAARHMEQSLWATQTPARVGRLANMMRNGHE